MNKLVDVVKIVENNEECVILEVVGQPIDLIKLGCFNGNETMFRLTKGDNHTCTVWYNNGRSFSWHWGIGGYTLVSDEVEKKGRLIQECIERDFEIYIGKNKALIRKTLYIKSLDDIKHNKHTVKMMYWKENGEICCHVDGDYYSHFKNIDQAMQHFEGKHYAFSDGDSYVAPTGCIVEVYNITR